MCKNKRTVSLKDAKGHQDDHELWSRRGFLNSLGMSAGGGVLFGGFSLSTVATQALAPILSSLEVEDRILVLIRLKGGNDGLNMIIPTFDYGTYQQGRPNIAIPQNQLLDLDNAFSIPNTMSELMPMWNDGKMKVINTVGYDNPNLSHFTSMDVWSSARREIESTDDKSGWLGRYLLDKNPNYLDELPEVPGAIKISSASSIAFYNSERIDLGVNFNTPERLLAVAESGFTYDTNNLPDECYYGDQVGFLRSIVNLTFNYAPQISEAYKSTDNNVSYENDELSRQLAIVARLIKGNLGTKLYMVTLDGFDTHENQNDRHPSLMRNISNAVSRFYQDLEASDLDNGVLTMAFSEFGRRIKENIGGTDHGTAAPVLMFGPSLNGNGILGDAPDLNDTDVDGNLKHSVDFRSIYATLLESWLCIDPTGVDSILGNVYERMPALGINCLNTSTSNEEVPLVEGIQHSTRPDGQGGTIISYSLDRPTLIDISVYSMLGQKIVNLYSGYQVQGQHEVRYQSRGFSSGSMPLVYNIVTKQKQYSGKFLVLN